MLSVLPRAVVPIPVPRAGDVGDGGLRALSPLWLRTRAAAQTRQYRDECAAQWLAAAGSWTTGYYWGERKDGDINEDERPEEEVVVAPASTPAPSPPPAPAPEPTIVRVLEEESDESPVLVSPPRSDESGEVIEIETGDISSPELLEDARQVRFAVREAGAVPAPETARFVGAEPVPIQRAVRVVRPREEAVVFPPVRRVGRVLVQEEEADHEPEPEPVTTVQDDGGDVVMGVIEEPEEAEDEQELVPEPEPEHPATPKRPSTPVAPASRYRRIARAPQYAYDVARSKSQGYPVQDWMVNEAYAFGLVPAYVNGDGMCLAHALRAASVGLEEPPRWARQFASGDALYRATANHLWEKRDIWLGFFNLEKGRGTGRETPEQIRAAGLEIFRRYARNPRFDASEDFQDLLPAVAADMLGTPICIHKQGLHGEPVVYNGESADTPVHIALHSGHYWAFVPLLQSAPAVPRLQLPASQVSSGPPTAATNVPLVGPDSTHEEVRQAAPRLAEAPEPVPSTNKRGRREEAAVIDLTRTRPAIEEDKGPARRPTLDDINATRMLAEGDEAGPGPGPKQFTIPNEAAEHPAIEWRADLENFLRDSRRHESVALPNRAGERVIRYRHHAGATATEGAYQEATLYYPRAYQHNGVTYPMLQTFVSIDVPRDDMVQRHLYLANRLLRMPYSEGDKTSAFKSCFQLAVRNRLACTAPISLVLYRLGSGDLNDDDEDMPSERLSEEEKRYRDAGAFRQFADPTKRFKVVEGQPLNMLNGQRMRAGDAVWDARVGRFAKPGTVAEFGLAFKFRSLVERISDKPYLPLRTFLVRADYPGLQNERPTAALIIRTRFVTGETRFFVFDMGSGWKRSQKGTRRVVISEFNEAEGVQADIAVRLAIQPPDGGVYATNPALWSSDRWDVIEISFLEPANAETVTTAANKKGTTHPHTKGRYASAASGGTNDSQSETGGLATEFATFDNERAVEVNSAKVRGLLSMPWDKDVARTVSLLRRWKKVLEQGGERPAEGVDFAFALMLPSKSLVKVVKSHGMHAVLVPAGGGEGQEDDNRVVELENGSRVPMHQGPGAALVLLNDAALKFAQRHDLWTEVREEDVLKRIENKLSWFPGVGRALKGVEAPGVETVAFEIVRLE